MELSTFLIEKGQKKAKALTSSASGFQYSVIDGMRTRSGSVKTFYSSNKENVSG